MAVPVSSAQREPSMEEILASIRRIIEDNETGRKPGEPDYGRPDNDVVDRAVIEVDAFRNELRMPSAETRTPAAETRTPPVETRTPPVEAMESVAARRDLPEKKPVTLAEVQEQVAAEARVAPAPRWTPEKPAAYEKPTADERIRVAIENARAASVEGTRSVPEDVAANVEKPSDMRAPEPVAAAPKFEVEKKPAPAPVPAIDRPAVVESTAVKPVILSERAERQVAASFGELSEAFAARSKKTFDDMAEEMMRPMLQDWLDNNLPVLVERLVREEIERVARGSQ